MLVHNQCTLQDQVKFKSSKQSNSMHIYTWYEKGEEKNKTLHFFQIIAREQDADEISSTRTRDTG